MEIVPHRIEVDSPSADLDPLTTLQSPGKGIEGSVLIPFIYPTSPKCIKALYRLLIHF
jgi:hypothetical protein